MSVERRTRATRIAGGPGHRASRRAGCGACAAPWQVAIGPSLGVLGRAGRRLAAPCAVLVLQVSADPAAASDAQFVNAFTLRGGPTVSFSLGNGERARTPPGGTGVLGASPFGFPFAPSGGLPVGDPGRGELRFGSTLRIDGRRRWTQIDARAESPGWGDPAWGAGSAVVRPASVDRPDGARLGPQFGFGLGSSPRLGGRSRFAPGVELGRPELRMVVSHTERIDDRTVVVFDLLRHRGVTGGRGNLVSTGLRRRLSPDSSVALAFGVGVGDATEQWRATVAYQVWF